MGKRFRGCSAKRLYVYIPALRARRNKPGCPTPELSANQRRLSKALSSCTVAKSPSCTLTGVAAAPRSTSYHAVGVILEPVIDSRQSTAKSISLGVNSTIPRFKQKSDLRQKWGTHSVHSIALGYSSQVKSRFTPPNGMQAKIHRTERHLCVSPVNRHSRCALPQAASGTEMNGRGS